MSEDERFFDVQEVESDEDGNVIVTGEVDTDDEELLEELRSGEHDPQEFADQVFLEAVQKSEDEIRRMIREELPDYLTEESDKTALADVDESFVIQRIEFFQDEKGGDPTTGEVADLIGEPREETKALLQDMEARDMLESYPIGRTDNWRLPGERDQE